MISKAVARRYAKGLFDTAWEMELFEKVAEELDQVVAILEQQPDLRKVLEYGGTPAKIKKEIIRNIFAESLSPVVLAFLELLIDKRRERALYDIRESYHDLLKKHKNIVVASVKTAYPLEPEFEAKLKETLKKATGKNIELQVSVHPELIGGLVVQIGDRVFDGSVTKRLEMMKASFMERSLGKLEVDM